MTISATRFYTKAILVGQYSAAVMSLVRQYTTAAMMLVKQNNRSFGFTF